MAMRWYLKPLDAFTGQAIVGELERRFLDSEVHSLQTNRGETVEVYEVEHRLIEFMSRPETRLAHPFRFRIFVREGEGKLREWRFPRKRKSRAWKPKTVEERVREILKEKADQKREG